LQRTLHDLRTGYILDFLLIGGHYNSRHIRKLILSAHDKHGLPHAGFYFEQGIWNANTINALSAEEKNLWRETQSGLESYGLQVKHATTPRAKTIEGFFRILQESQRNEPGFAGFNERVEKMERMQDFLALVRAGRADPAERLFTMAQWAERLSGIMAGFNAEVQNGKMLREEGPPFDALRKERAPGRSPLQAWQAGLDRKPLRKLPDAARYLLATHCRKVAIRQNGIVLNDMCFCSEKTGPLIGRKVLAFYSFECPELLTITDLNRQNPFTVKGFSLPAMSATKEQFHAARAQIAGHTRHAREIYGSIKHPRAAAITRDTASTGAAAALGEFHNEATASHRAEQAAETRTRRKLQAAAAGRVLPGHLPPSRLLAACELENTYRQDHAAIPAPEPAARPGHAPGRKNYVLKVAPDAPTTAQYWSLWAQVEKADAGANRHALTQKILGSHPQANQMSPADLSKMISCFAAILRDANQAATP
jgi:hypothetical protein